MSDPPWRPWPNLRGVSSVVGRLTAIVDDDTFTFAQQVLTRRGTGPQEHKPHRTRKPYQLRGRLICGYCQRRMQGEWNNNAPYYRCRFPQEYAIANRVDHPRNVYVREDHIVPHLDRWIVKIFAPHRLAELVDDLMAGQLKSAGSGVEAAQSMIDECDRKISRCRAALDAGGDPVEIARWINETKAERGNAEIKLRAASAGARLDREAITRLVAGVQDHIGLVRDADPEDKADLYR